MIQCFVHMSPGRIHGHHHVSDQDLGKCPVCGKMVIRWSLMEPGFARDLYLFFSGKKVKP